MKQNSLRIRTLVYAAFCLALAMVLPLFTGQIPQIGKALCPMHLPALLCGFLCGAPWGAVVGLIAPLLRSLAFGVPSSFTALTMTFELATYGAVAGFLYRRLPRTLGGIYVCLLISMVSGRAVWGLARFILAGLQATEFPFSAFLAGAFTTAVPGILAQLILVPALVSALEHFGLTCNTPQSRNP